MKFYQNIFLIFLVLFSFAAQAAPKEINELTEGRVVRSTDLIPIDRDISAITTTGTAQAGGASTITLAAAASAVNDFYNAQTINIIAGKGIGESKTISDYVGSTKVLTVDSPWLTQPDSTSIYEIRSTTHVTYNVNLSDQIYRDIKSLGAICDGESHPLSAASKTDPTTGYGTLSAAQVDFPLVTSLDQEIDQVVIENEMSNNRRFYVSEGTCFANYASSLSNKTFYMKSHPLGIIKQTGTPVAETFTCTACNAYYEGINFDGENKTQVPFYFNNPLNTTFLDWDIQDFGWGLSVQATNMAAPMWLNGTFTKNYVFDRGYSADVTTLGDGTTGNSIGGARLSPWITPSSSQKPNILIRDLYMDATGSDAEELDLFNQNVNVVFGSWIQLDNIGGCYNGNVRRLLKNHSGDMSVNQGHFFKCSDFVTAPTAVHTTDVGAKTLTAIDNAGAGQGSITLIGGLYDVSGFPTGFAGTSSCTDCHIKGVGTEFIGSPLRYNRHDPELAISGTVAAATSNTITFPSATSSSSNSFYNGASVVIGGPCSAAGQKGIVSSYVGSTRVATMTGSWTPNTPDNTCTFTVYKYQIGFSIAMATGSSDRGSGCDGCYFKNASVPWQGRGYQSYLRNSVLDDPGHYAFWLNPASSARTGNIIDGNTIITRTSGRMNLDSAWGVSGTAQAGSATTITLASGSSSTDGAYVGGTLTTTGGTGSGQTKTITAYDGLTKVATVSTWSVNPDATTTYTIGGSSLFRMAPVQVGTNYRITNNRFIQDGNTDHQCVWIDELTASVGGVVAYNDIPSGALCTGSAALDDHRKLAASVSTVVGNNYQIETVLNVNTTTVGNVGTGEDVLQTYSVQSNSLSKAGQGIVIRGAGDFANNANSKTLTYDIGGTNILSQALPTSLAGTWKVDVVLFRTGASTQMYDYELEYTSSAGVTTSLSGNGTLSLTDTSAIVVRGEGSATSNNDITQDLHFIKQVN